MLRECIPYGTYHGKYAIENANIRGKIMINAVLGGESWYQKRWNRKMRNF
jgi:hypothetical protein